MHIRLNISLQLIILLVLVSSITSCTQTQPLPPECKNIDCELPVAFYPKGGNTAIQFVAQLKYTNCCGKKPTGILEKHYSENTKRTTLSNINNFCKNDRIQLNMTQKNKNLEYGIQINKQAISFFQKKEYKKAFSCFLKSSKITAYYFGKKHYATAISYRALGASALALNHNEDALKYYLLSLKIYKSLNDKNYKLEIIRLKTLINNIKEKIQQNKFLYQKNIIKKD